ncbi:hypothetical protein J5N97_006570 [Dioscorea zingiberensis]|uniref:Cardiolipin synthase N-terminal domain-containing protein n=1 Tax=Dioscorea zingiberensis TaxID=325984 RepID=A0A9D5DB20_9LILI|nr:hypothetical protein J5N97_006570 [Dioscorea zingiberensis]
MASSSQSLLLSLTLPSSFHFKPRPRHPPLAFQRTNPLLTLNPRTILGLEPHTDHHHSFARRGLHLIRCSSIERQSNEGEGKPVGEERSERGNDWTTSVLLFGFWAGLMYYVFQLTPNQTPVRDEYFLQKLVYLKGDDGFRMNEVLVAEWYIMGVWPLIYSMLLIPTGRSSQSKIPIWPFLVLSLIGGCYALIPYFVLWKPPPPPVEEDELGKWPLNFLESKITAAVTLVAGLGCIVYAGLANEDVWKEFYQYFRESKFIHIMSIDFLLFTTFSPFWVYNDMAARKWVRKGSWLLPFALVPFVGPALYLLLRPSLSALPTISSAATETE